MTEAAGPAATPATAPGPGPALDRLLDKVPELRGRREVEELAGGLTNRNYKVVSDQGAYVVRVSPREADALAINRENEYENSVRAAAAGVGAPVIAFLPEDGITVIGFLDGETYTDESFQAPGVIPRVAQAVRQLIQGDDRDENRERRPNRVPGRVVLTGGASQLVGLTDLASRILKRPVRIGRPLGIAGLPDAAKGPAFAVAAGLLVYPQAAHLEHFEPRRTRQLMTGTGGYMARVGRWLRESF